jgi:hypothetical protein
MLFPLQISQNRLGYPGRSPGFDGSHPASVNARFSAIAGSSNFLTTFALSKATLGATAPTFGLDGALGPCGIFTSAVNPLSGCNFSGQFAGLDLVATSAAIIRLSNLTAFNAIFSSNQNNNTNGYLLTVSPSGEPQFQLPGFVAAPTNSTDFPNFVTVGVPYFIVVSVVSGRVNLLSLNLNTGQIKTATQTGNAYTAAAGNGTMGIGVNHENAYVAVGNIAAVMYSGTFLTLPQMTQWAQDPWAFWYPRVQLPLVKPAPPPTVAVGSTLIYMGAI